MRKREEAEQRKLRVIDPDQPFSYAHCIIPTTYKCGKCGKEGVKLWRRFQTFMGAQKLFCIPCAFADQELSLPPPEAWDQHGTYPSEPWGRHDQIGWLVPAIPTEENDTFWGYTSVPQAGCQWWYNLDNGV